MAEKTSKNEAYPIIAAIATPRGRGAISCIRISGEGSAALAEKLTGVPFAAACAKTKYHARMVPCTFDGGVRDRIMAVVYYGDKSFTGEESAELYFHGGVLLTEKALRGILDAGARLAEPGEFTRRAFLHGKIDLTQAEGIIDLIDAESPAALAAAYEQSEGNIRKEIDALYERGVALAARAEVCIDYPEEDLEEQETPVLEKDIDGLLRGIEAQLAAYDSGRIVRQGARVVLTGETNAGKSTLFNTLLGCDRAIVSDEAGTTRDTIEEKFLADGQLCVLVDTAGVRDTDSKVEQMGIERSRAAVASADIVVKVVRADAIQGTALPVDTDEILAVNYTGTPTSVAHAIALNALTGEGTDALSRELASRIRALTPQTHGINNPRHYQALRAAAEALTRARTALHTLTLDCVCADLRAALDALGAVTGKRADEEIISSIFANFCVGK